MAHRHMARGARLGTALATAALLAGLGGSTVLAGEVTGNGRLLDMHGRSECSFSGQEDLQYFTDDSDTTAKPATRGDPGHAQSWGQIPKDVRDFLATIGLHPGTACNPTKSGGGEP
jgi:hypothetical protein